MKFMASFKDGGKDRWLTPQMLIIVEGRSQKRRHQSFGELIAKQWGNFPPRVLIQLGVPVSGHAES